MNDSTHRQKYRGAALAKNSLYNLIGFGIPLLVALIALPSVLHGLGQERFGLLSIAWVIIGYFSLFDLGIGRSVTKIIAEHIGSNASDIIPRLFWTAFYMMLALSICATFILLFFVPWIVFDVLKISSDLRTETLYSFYLLVLSLPIVTTSASVRGILEAYQEFRTINVIRTILGISGFVMPLLCMIFTKSLFWIVLSLVILRIVLWMMYFYKSFKVNPALKSVGMFDRSLLKPIFRLSSWMSVSSIIVPLNIYLDRFMIGAAISASAIALYTTPYELVSKLLIIPSAFAGVMFPAISATYINDPDYSKTLLIRASKYIFLILYPIVFLIIAFAPEGMAWWVGEPFAKNSYIVLQILAIGILFNSLGYIPYAFIDGIGRPDVNAKIQIIELPFYFFLLWLGIAKGGITGAAIVWSFRTAIDSVVLWFCSKKINPVPNTKIIEPSLTWGVPFIILPIVMILIGVTLSMKILVTVIILSIFMVITWHSLLEKEEREFMFSKLISLTQGRGTNNATKS